MRYNAVCYSWYVARYNAVCYSWYVVRYNNLQNEAVHLLYTHLMTHPILFQVSKHEGQKLEDHHTEMVSRKTGLTRQFLFLAQVELKLSELFITLQCIYTCIYTRSAIHQT